MENYRKGFPFSIFVYRVLFYGIFYIICTIYAVGAHIVRPENR